MRLNSTTFSFKSNEATYKMLEGIATSMAVDARCANVYTVSLHKQASSDTFNCVFKTADTTPGIPGPAQNNTQNVQPNQQNNQSQQADISPDDANKIKSDAVTNYIQENNVPINNKTDLDNVVNSVNQTQLTPDQLANNSQNQDPSLVQKITTALQNTNPVQ